MGLLTTAVVDVAMLVATCRALKSGAAEGGEDLQRKLRRRLRTDIKRGTVAYLDALAKHRRGVVDDALLVQCRIAAEHRMPLALAHQALLRDIMRREAGSLDGMAAARQDLWRLAYLARQLGTAMVAFRAAGGLVGADAAEILSARLRRRIRKALLAYARAALRTKARRGRLILKARDAALAEIGVRGAAEAERLAALEVGKGASVSGLHLTVTGPILDLVMDWRRDKPEVEPPIDPSG